MYGINFLISNGSPACRQYKFGGKELITANGLNEYDFGARRYYSAVPHFTAIDPLCEKYYWLSPYVYCANNPVNFVDPTGKDTWNLDSEGHVISHEIHDNYDEIIINDENNKPKSSWRGDYGSISNQYESIDRNGKEYGIFETPNDATGTPLFEFLAKSTSVEWSQFKTGIDSNNMNMLTTSFDNNTDNGASEIICNKSIPFPIREWSHNHPNNTRYPSGLEQDATSGDIPFAKKIDMINSIQAKYRLFLPGSKEYVTYKSSASVYDEEYNMYFKNLDTFEIVLIKNHKKK